MKIKNILLCCSSTFIWAETITLTPIDIHETVQSSGTVVLSEEEALETNSITLQERLANDVSFSVVADRKGEAAISFRGLDFKSTAYVEDGIPLYRSANVFTDTKFTMTNTALQLNDVSGTSSFGVSPMGGEVQITSTNPSKEFESQLDTSFSNNDEYYHAYVGSMVDNVYIKADADYYHRSKYRLSDDYDPTLLQKKGSRVNSDKEQKNIALKSGIFIDDQIHLAAKVSLTRSEYGMPPNVYTDLQAPVWDAYSRIDRKDLNSYYLYGDYSSDDLKLSIRAYYDDYEDIYKIYNDPAYLSSWPTITYDDDRLGTVLKGSKTRDNHTSTLVFLAEENKHTRSGGDLAKAKYKADTFKMSFMHLREINSLWQVEGGVSYTLMQAKEAADASALLPSDDKDALDTQLKLTYTQNQGEIYGSIAHKSRMPTLSEMFTFFPWENANPGLKPEKSMQYTMGYQQTLEEKTFMALSVYYYDVKDLILYRDNGYINRENAKHYGTEIRLNSSYFDKNALRFSYAYTHTRDSEGEDLELIPLHQLKIEDTLRLSAKLNAYLGYQYVGSRYSANSATYSDEQLKLSGYHLVDTQLAYRLSSDIQGRAGIKNILDESYEWEYGYPTQGRSYYLYLEWKL
jgi:iron complex outermembrane receptor protein